MSVTVTQLSAVQYLVKRLIRRLIRGTARIEGRQLVETSDNIYRASPPVDIVKDATFGCNIHWTTGTFRHVSQFGSLILIGFGPDVCARTPI